MSLRRGWYIWNGFEEVLGHYQWVGVIRKGLGHYEWILKRVVCHYDWVLKRLLCHYEWVLRDVVV